MVRWYHLIMTAYGFWLPNDPRGSWTDFVGSWELYKFGEATTVNTKRSLAHDDHDHAARLAAKAALKYPQVRFNSLQRQAVAQGFQIAVKEASYQIGALCIGYDHVHAIVARHERTIELIARHMKSKATMCLTRVNQHPLQECRANDGSVPTPWAKNYWSVFINDEAQLAAAVAYVERRPQKEGLAAQSYGFLTPMI